MSEIEYFNFLMYPVEYKFKDLSEDNSCEILTMISATKSRLSVSFFNRMSIENRSGV